VTHYAKARFAPTGEIRMLRVNNAVRSMLVRHDTHWAKRSNSKGGFTKVDVLIVTDLDLWSRLLPYFTYDLETSGAGRKHYAREIE
jgi:hypothetical protein